MSQITNMRTTKIIFWISTSIVALMMTMSVWMYFTNPEVSAGFVHLGFSDTFRLELGVAKLLGIAGLLIPLPARLKEWVYAGFTFTFISAFVAHTAAGDPLKAVIMPLIVLGVLAVSYWSYHKLQGVSGTLKPSVA